MKFSRYTSTSKGHKITNIFFYWHANRINILLESPCVLEIVVFNFSIVLKLFLTSVHPSTLWHLCVDNISHLKRTKEQETSMCEWYYFVCTCFQGSRNFKKNEIKKQIHISCFHSNACKTETGILHQSFENVCKFKFK